MDKLVLSCLEQLGFDTKQAIVYLPSKHRSMQGKVAVDFIACGEINRDKKYRHLLDTTQRIVAVGYSDASLAREMEDMLGRTRNYQPDDMVVGKMSKKEREYRLENDIDLSDEDEYDVEYIEDDYDMVLAQIKQLEEIRDTLRGPMFNSAGGLKLPNEYNFNKGN